MLLIGVNPRAPAWAKIDEYLESVAIVFEFATRIPSFVMLKDFSLIVMLKVFRRDIARRDSMILCASTS